MLRHTNRFRDNEQSQEKEELDPCCELGLTQGELGVEEMLQAMGSLAHQYQQLMQEPDPTEEQIAQITAILELAQYDKTLGNMIDLSDDVLMSNLESPG